MGGRKKIASRTRQGARAAQWYVCESGRQVLLHIYGTFEPGFGPGREALIISLHTRHPCAEIGLLSSWASDLTLKSRYTGAIL